MKKILSFVGIISLIGTTSAPILACGSDGVPGTITFNIYKTPSQRTPSFTEKLTAKADQSLADVMKPYAGKWFTWKKDQVGYFITSMIGLKGDKNHYWSIHSPTNKKQCPSPKNNYSCLYGVSKLHLQHKEGIYNFYYTDIVGISAIKLPFLDNKILNLPLNSFNYLIL